MRFESKDFFEPQYWRVATSDVVAPEPRWRFAPLDHLRREVNRLWQGMDRALRVMDRPLQLLKRQLQLLNRLLRDTLREMALLSLPVKALIAVALTANFVVITQWERLPFGAPAAPKASTPPAPAVQGRDFNFEQVPAASADTVAAQEALLRRMATITIDDPKVENDGSIRNDGQAIYLYGLKRFDSKGVCTRASGERWACGLRAYATLRNELAHKTIVCQPKKILERGLAATCRIGDQDVALILVRNGLVEVEDGANMPGLLAVQDAARTSRIGIWDR